MSDDRGSVSTGPSCFSSGYWGIVDYSCKKSHRGIKGLECLEDEVHS